ncbi:MAG: alpha/beta hydrolase [Chloroflexia bacterium]|nr:alpha/beta hydrolase [Chloroflexia bacterium]
MAFDVREVRGEIRTPDGITLSTASWVPDHPKAVALLAHGHAEHIGRYTHVIQALTGHGYAVYSQDHRGHGRSGGERALAMRFDNYIDDFRLMALKAQAAHTDLPVVLIGHSMGGLIAARYALAHGSDLTALVTSGAAFTIDEGVSPLKRWLARVIARIAPKAPVPRGEGDKLSYDPAVGAAFQDDPLNYHGKTRMRTAVEMSNAGADALARAATLRLPYLAMHGADDTLTSPRGTGRFHERARSTDKTLVLWPRMKHEVFNEIDGQAVIDFTIDWLDARIP